MSNYVMQVDFFGNSVRCETENLTVSLNDLFTAGNAYRLSTGKPAYQLASFINSATTKEYLQAASDEWGIPEDALLYKVGKGKYTRTMAHVSVALLAAEMISPRFHARAHRELIEGKLLEFRDYGGTEFKKLNVAIDAHLPGREGKSNKGIYINLAKMVRGRVLGKDTPEWDKANSQQTRLRYEIENKLVEFLRLGLVRDWDHLKEIIEKV